LPNPKELQKKEQKSKGGGGEVIDECGVLKKKKGEIGVDTL
jgi:hypothetical protein